MIVIPDLFGAAKQGQQEAVEDNWNDLLKFEAVRNNRATADQNELQAMLDEQVFGTKVSNAVNKATDTQLNTELNLKQQGAKILDADTSELISRAVNTGARNNEQDIFTGVGAKIGADARALASNAGVTDLRNDQSDIRVAAIRKKIANGEYSDLVARQLEAAMAVADTKARNALINEILNQQVFQTGAEYTVANNKLGTGQVGIQQEIQTRTKPTVINTGVNVANNAETQSLINGLDAGTNLTTAQYNYDNVDTTLQQRELATAQKELAAGQGQLQRARQLAVTSPAEAQVALNEANRLLTSYASKTAGVTYSPKTFEELVASLTASTATAGFDASGGATPQVPLTTTVKNVANLVGNPNATAPTVVLNPSQTVTPAMQNLFNQAPGVSTTPVKRVKPVTNDPGTDFLTYDWAY